MKVAILLFALLAASVCAKRTESEYRAAWASFLGTHSKFYTSDVETLKRYQIFKENVDFIDTHNSKSDVSFTVAINKFADLTGQEFAAMMLGNTIDSTKYEQTNVHSDVDVSVPSSYNWNDHGAVTPIKNQGQCGSCWSFSTTGSVEGCTYLATGHLVGLSEENLMSCSQSFGNNGCNGGLMDNAFKYIISNGGIDTESSWPYEASVTSCRYTKGNCGATISSYRDVSRGSESALLTAAARTPISVAIDASHSSFQFYSGGVYYEPECSSSQLDHGVLVVGWGVDQSSSTPDYWIVKNSWGPQWGKNGFIWMARNKNNNCGIASMASYPTGCSTC